MEYNKNCFCHTDHTYIYIMMIHDVFVACLECIVWDRVLGMSGILQLGTVRSEIIKFSPSNSVTQDEEFNSKTQTPTILWPACGLALWLTSLCVGFVWWKVLEKLNYFLHSFTVTKDLSVCYSLYSNLLLLALKDINKVDVNVCITPLAC